MGTRGAMGFRMNGQDKITYNHFDSYPSGLGQTMLDFLRDVLSSEGEGWLRDKVRDLRLIDEDNRPSPEDIVRLGHLADRGVSSGALDEWYVLLRSTQGEPDAILAAGVLIDSRSFLQDSLFCEWAYIINLDERVLEVYKGFQQKPHGMGRYSTLPPIKEETREYYPVALEDTFPFDALPEHIPDRDMEEEDIEDIAQYMATPAPAVPLDDGRIFGEVKENTEFEGSVQALIEEWREELSGEYHNAGTAYAFRLINQLEELLATRK